MTDISVLEELMPPGKLSREGFLGFNESLEKILKEDNEAVKKLGFTHEQIADRLEYILNAAEDLIHQGKSQNIVDSRYEVDIYHTDGMQECPWGDAGGHLWNGIRDPETWDGKSHYADHNSILVTITDVYRGDRIEFSGSLVHLIRTHHFYEGKHTKYRLNPKDIVRCLFSW